MPAAVSTRANPPSTENSHAEKRGRQMELAIASSMVSPLTIGSWGSTAHPCWRSAAANDKGSPAVRTTMVERKTPNIACRYGRYNSAFGGVSSLLGEGGLPFRQLASGRFQYRGTGVESFGRRLSEQIGGEVQLLPRRLQLLDQRRGAHLTAIRRSGPRRPDLCWWPPDPVCTCRSGTRRSGLGRGWPESSRRWAV